MNVYYVDLRCFQYDKDSKMKANHNSKGIGFNS